MSHDGEDMPLLPRAELIAAVLAGDRARDDAEVQAACSDPAFARLLDELLQLRLRLQRADVAQRDSLTRTPDPLEPALSVLAAAHLRALRRRRRLRWWSLVAAAMVLGAATVLFLWPEHQPSESSPRTLDGSQPVRCGPGYAEVTWNADPGRWQFEVRVFRDGQLVERSVPTRTRSWRPTKRDEYGPEVMIELWLVGTEIGDGRRIGFLRVGADGRSR